MKRIYLITTLLTLLIYQGFSQTLTNYTFAPTSGTFTALIGATSTSGYGTGTTNEGYLNAIPIGFDFFYMGVRYTTISASTNGWLTLGANITSATPINNLSTGGAPRPVLAPLWDDLDIQTQANATFLTSGTAGSRVFTLELLNNRWDYQASGNTISFQVKLYEATGRIQYVYRQENAAGVNAGSASIGITGTATGSGNFLSLNGTGTAPTVSSTTETTTLSVKPATGQTYTFTPPVPTAAPANLTFSGVTTSSMTLNWTQTSSNETGFVIYRSTDGTNYSYISQTAANATSSLQAGLTAQVTYYWRVFAVTEGGLSTALSGTRATSCTPPNISQIPTSNLILNYKFTGSANSETGTNNGTLQNAPATTTDRFGIAGSAYTFNGSSQYVSTANSYVNPTNFTSSIWFKTATVSGGLLMGFGNLQTGSSANHDRKIYMNNAGQVYFGVYTGTTVTINSALSYNDNNWHLATVTLSGTAGMVLYIDGVQVASNTNTIAENITGYWRIGYDNLATWPSVPTSYYFNGSLDDALVYHTALNSTQVATLYNSPDGAGNNGPCAGSPLNLTATTVSGAAYSWTGPNSFTSSSQNPTLTYTAAHAGVYTVQVSLSGCTSTAYTTVTSATTSSTISYAGTPFCKSLTTGQAVTLTGTAGGTYSSTAGLTINASTGAITPGTSTAGTYTVTYTISGGCTATASITVTATPTIAAAGADQTGAATCGLTTVTLAANAPTSGTGAWSIVSGTGGTITTPSSPTSTFSGIAGNSYTLRWTISNSPCTSSADDVVITFNQNLTSVSGTSTETCVGGSTGTITGSGSGGAAPYTYSLNAGAYQIANVFTGIAAGSYTLNVRSNGGCVGSTTVVVSNPANSTDDQDEAGTNTWIGHVYDGIAFNNYIGRYNEPETFNQNFGSSTSCFNVSANSVARSIRTETFSVRYRMLSTKKGLFVTDLGSDDGSRLTVNGTLVYNNWSAQSYTVKPRVLMNLDGASSLLFEYYEQNGGNQVSFQNVSLVLANTLSANIAQNICTGLSGSAIEGDVYGVLPTGISLSGTGYQWSFSTSPSGARTNISGATGATYTPSGSLAPFNVAGTYYLYRNALLSSTNNISPNPFVASNESNAAIVTISTPPSANISYSGSPYCSNTGQATVTRTGTEGGTYSSAEGLSIDASTGTINLLTSTAGTYSVNYTIPASGGCTQVIASADVTVSASPAISQIPGAAIIANYNFNGNASDALGNNNGTLQNAPVSTADRFGNIGGAFSFNGTNQYVSTSNSYVNPAQVSVSIWFKTNTTTGGKLIGFGNGQTGLSGNYDRHIYMNNAGQIYFGVYTGTAVTINSAASYNDNNWHLATATLSATAGMALYIDGAVVATNTTTTTAENFTGYWKIGGDNLNGWPLRPTSNFFNGTLDDALVYHRALTASEAGTLYVSPDGAGNTGLVCTGSSISLTATNVPGATYAWTGPNGFVSSSSNPSFTHTVAAVGTYKVLVTANGCTAEAYTNIQSFNSTGQWTGSVSSDWANVNNWCSGNIPTSATNVTIAAGVIRMPVITSTASCNNLTIAAGASVSTTASGTLNIAGALVNNGTMNNNGTTMFDGTGVQQTFSGVTSFYNLTLNNPNGLLLPAATIVGNSLTLLSGTLNSNNLPLSVAGNWTNNASADAFAGGTSMVTFNGTATQTIGGTFTTSFNNLVVDKTTGIGSLAINASIAGNLTITSGTLDLSTYTANRLSAGGVLTVNNNATLKIGGTNTYPANYATSNLVVGGTVEYSGTNQAVANQVYGNLKLSSASGSVVKTFSDSAITVQGNFTSTVGTGTAVTFNAGAAITVGGDVSIGASTTFNAGSFSHVVGGSWVNGGTFNGNTGTVTFNGTGKQVSGSGTQNFNNVTVAAPSLTFSNGSITLTGNLATTISGSFSQLSGGTLTMTGAGKTISGTGIALDNFTVSGSVSTAASFSVKGHFTVSGSFVASAGTITLSGISKNVSGAGTKVFNTVSATGTITTDADFTISSGLTVSGSFSASSGTATFTGTSGFKRNGQLV